MTTDGLQEISCAAIEDKEAMANFTSINLTLSQSLTQAQKTILVISNQLQELQAQLKAKKPTTEKMVLDKNKRENKPKIYSWTHGRTAVLTISYHPRLPIPKDRTPSRNNLGEQDGRGDKWYKE